MSRLFWLLLGAGLAFFAISKGRTMLHRVTPAGVVEQVEKRSQQAASGFGDFYATFKAAAAAREAELRDELNLPKPSNSAS